MILSDWLFILLLLLAALAWRHFTLALLAVLALLPAYLLRLNIGGIPTTWLELAIYILFIVFLARGRWRSQLKIKWLGSWLLPVVLWLAAAVVAIFIAPDKRLALGILKGWIIDPLILVYLFINELNLAADQDNFVSKMVKAFWLSGVITGLSSTIMTLLAPTGRTYGWYDSPNVLAMYLTPLLVLTVLWSGSGFFTRHFSSGKKVIWWSGNAVMFLALIQTGSYSGLLSLLLSLGLAGLLTRFNYQRWLGGIGLSLMLCGLLVPFIFVRYDYWPPLRHYNDKYELNSGQVRLILWREALAVIKTKPVFGLGLGQWQPYFLKQVMPHLSDAKRPGWAIELYYASLFPHNLWLTTWLYLGVGGVVALIWLAGKSVRTAGKERGLLIPAVVLISILMQGVVDTPLFKNDWAIMVWLLFGLFFWYDSKSVGSVAV